VIHEHAIDYVIVDSIGPAASGSLKDEDTALAYNRALRSLGIGSLSIAHLPKPREGTTDDNSSIFGSVFFFNMARSVWHLRQATEAATDSSITVGFYHRKNNLGRKCQPLGYELRFDGAYPRVRRVDLAAVDGLAEKLPLQQRMKHLLKRGPRTVDDLAAELGAKPETLKRVYRRFSGESKFAMFQRVPGDGPERIALLHRGAA
jgi:AraC-like DNA-binding protein